jgi:hypothetical protein
MAQFDIRSLTLVRPLKDSSSLLCTICFEILAEPQRIMKCGHVFCLGCLSPLNKCPLDRAVILLLSLILFTKFTNLLSKPIGSNDYQLDRTIRSLIEELEVLCPNKDTGCKWTGEYSDLSHHLQTCRSGEGQEIAELWNYIKAAKKREELLVNRIEMLEEMYQNLEEKNKALEGKVDQLRSEISSPPEVQSLDLNNILDTIEVTIFGPNGGAVLYDAGYHQECFNKYLELAVKIMAKTPASQQNEFWYKIFSKAVQITNEKKFSTSSWGTRNDPAWMMRFALEAIKKKAADMGHCSQTQFWSRFTDSYGFLQVK